MIIIGLAGWLAELILDGKDEKQNYEIKVEEDIDWIKTTIELFYPKDVAEVYFDYMYFRTRNILKLEWDLVTTIANELITQKTLGARKLKMIVYNWMMSRVD